MSGLEILGAVAAAVQLAASAVGTFRFINSEYGKYHEAEEELRELGASVDSVYADLWDVKAKMEKYYVQDAFDREPHWATACVSGLDSATRLLKKINTALDDTHRRSAWKKPFDRWKNADTIRDLARRLDQSRPNVRGLKESPPL